MARTLATSNKQAALRNAVAFGFFVQIDWPSGVARYHSSIGTYTWGGNDWIGVGDLGSVEAVEETIDTAPRDIRLSFSALNDAIIADVLDNDYWNRDVDIYVGFFDAQGALVADPDLFWSGFVNTAELSCGTDNVVAITCWSRAGMMEKANRRRYTSEDLEERYGGDLFLEFLPEMLDVTLTWGGEKVRGKKDNTGNNIGTRGTETQSRQA